MQLSELLHGIATIEQNRIVTGLNLNSSDIQQGDVFFAMSGTQQHGLRFARQAAENGAVAIIYEIVNELPALPALQGDCILLGVDNLRYKLGHIAARFYQHPSQHMDVIGITGTNGKTSCSQFLAQCLPHCAAIGTLGWGKPGALEKTLNTTPDAISLQNMLASLLSQQVKQVAMEVSSHGLEQGRVNGIYFKGAVYTNISRDHLDYHGSMQAYIKEKLSLLSKPGIEFVVVNLDDLYCDQVIHAIKPGIAVWTFSKHEKQIAGANSLLLSNSQLNAEGLKFDVTYQSQRCSVSAAVFGDFNVANVMTVFTILMALNIPFNKAAQLMRTIRPISGRMEHFCSSGRAQVFVDYAHTPDALNNVLKGLRQHCKHKLWVIFGCGGDRDKGKRPQMGQIASQWADQIVLTNDNPRTENADNIISEILAGIKSDYVEVIHDRATAIQTVLNTAQQHDLVLIAGKGHEDYQEINGKKLPFSDILMVKQFLNITKSSPV